MSIGKRLYDRAIAMIGLGRGTTAVTDGGAIRTVQAIFVTTGELRDGVQVMQEYGFASRPHPGCDHAVLTLSGDPTKSLIVAGNDQRYRLTLAEGEVGIHDDQAQSVIINRAGIAWTDKSGNTLTSTSAGFVLQDHFGNQIVTSSAGILLKSCTGIVSVDNEIAGTQEGGTGATFTGTVNTTGDIIANVGGAQVSLLNHVHSGVQTGGGNTAAPVAGT